jgi:UDP-N-acetylmuramate dehydrogenase
MIIFPDSQKQLSLCLKWINNHGFSFKVIGETSNLMFLDEVDYGIFISTTKISSLYFDSDASIITAECGALLPALSRFALSYSVTGFEGFEGIPGTVGAAIYMNAGAYGDEIKNVVDSVDVLLPDGTLKTYSFEQLRLSHRSSIFRSQNTNEIIFCARFKANFGDLLSIYNRMSLLHSKRHKYQEFMYPTLGSVYSGSIYRALAKKDFYYKIISSVYYLVFYKWKLFRREAPDNRKWLNDFTIKRFGITYDNQPFSNKDMNTLVNNGHHTDQLLDYLDQLHALIGHDIPIENEIVKKF